MKNIYLLYKSKLDKYTILICLLCLVYLFVTFAGISSISVCGLMSDTAKIEKIYNCNDGFKAVKQFEKEGICEH